MNIVDNLTEAQIAEVMAGLTKEEIFYCTAETDHNEFGIGVIQALSKPLEVRSDIFTLVFDDRYDKDSINNLVKSIAEERKRQVEEWRKANPDLIDAPNPDNPIKSRWIRTQYESERKEHRP